MSRAPTLRVLVVDDDDAFACVLQAVLESAEEGLSVVGRAADGRAAVELARSLRPDVVTMDIDMPIMDGVAATRAIAAAGILVVAVTGSGSMTRIEDVLAAGAVAWVPKMDATTSLAGLLRLVATAGAARRCAA
jgi:CheY-like chemotaxis protein